ncbi:MAG: hypothetical protein EOO63_09115, partial [Hymenobacter sp.]
MKQLYKGILIGLSPLVGLSSCSQEAAPENASPELSAAATGSVVIPAETSISMPVSKDNSNDSQEGKPAYPKKHAANHWDKRQQANHLQLLQYASLLPKVTTTTCAQQLALSPGVEVASKVVLIDTAAAKVAQVFWIRPDHDTLLVGAEGTTVWVPAQVFEQQRAPVLSGEVEVRLREFYTLADILLQRLTTTAGPALLETSGMVQLTATANGQACTLKRGSSLEVTFPTRQFQENMQLFNGVSRPNQRLDWQPANKSWAATTRERPWCRPLYPHGYGGMRGHLRRQLAFTEATAQRLQTQRQPRQVRRWLRCLGRERRTPLLGAVLATLELSASGQPTNILLPTATDAELGAIVRQALQKMTTSWRPATTSWGLAVRSQLAVEVLFTADQRVLVEHLRWNEGATKIMYRTDQAKHQLPAAAQLRNATASEAAAYIFQATNLGWLNCDQFIYFASPLIRQQLAMAGVHAEVSLVLKNRRTVLPSGMRAGQICFERVPKGEAATLVAI